MPDAFAPDCELPFAPSEADEPVLRGDPGVSAWTAGSRTVRTMLGASVTDAET
jgi:hypothetical protein